MAYSINFYLDGAVSEKNQKSIFESGDSEAKRNLKDQVENKPLPVFLYLRFSGQLVKVYVERKCTQKEWDVQKQRVNPRFFKSGAIELNQYFDKVESETAKLHEKNLFLSFITAKEDIAAIVAACNNRQLLPSQAITFEQAFQEFIDVNRLRKAGSTIGTYRTTLKHLKLYAEHSKLKLRFEKINAQFDTKFREYLIEVAGLTNNSISKYVKKLKEFMNFCTEDRGYNSKLNTAYQKFDTTEREKEVYVLSMNELMHLYQYKFKKEHYRNVRDVFCFQCFTGLRFSDVEKLVREDIQEDGVHLITKKTKQQNVIPLNTFALEILKKYNDCEKPLPVISNQKTNDLLHEIGEMIGLTELVKVVQFIGTEVKETYVPKYKILTTHIGRKTFITNSLILGMQERTIRAISGHKSEANFRRYVAFANDYKQKAMNETWNKQRVAKTKR